MGEKTITAIGTPKYGALLARTRPKVIRTDEELDRSVAMLERLDRRAESGEILSAEERELQALLACLIRDYDKGIGLPEASGLEVLRYLMEHGGITQADLLPVFGSRSVVSAVLAGTRDLSKAHIRGLAKFFDLSPAAFI
jgi:HTH-type transcriptional regulator / antitoxin HigA